MVVVDNNNVLGELGEVNGADSSDLGDVNELSLLEVANGNMVGVDRLDLVAGLGLGNESSSGSVGATLGPQTNHVSLCRTSHVSKFNWGRSPLE